MQTSTSPSGSASTRRELFNGRVKSGARTFFMDVIESGGGHRCLSICESRATGDGVFQRQRIMLSADQADEFVRCFREALRALKTGNFTASET